MKHYKRHFYGLNKTKTKKMTTHKPHKFINGLDSNRFSPLRNDYVFPQHRKHTPTKTKQNKNTKKKKNSQMSNEETRRSIERLTAIVNTGFQQINTRLDELERNQNNRFDAVDNRLDGLEGNQNNRFDRSSGQKPEQRTQ